mgnify:CR=1 FL=1
MGLLQVCPMPALVEIPVDIAVTLAGIPRHLLFSGEGIPGIWKDVKSLPRRTWNNIKGTGTYVLGKPLVHTKLKDVDPSILGE